MQVVVHLPGSAANEAVIGRVTGFYANEPRRAVVVLPSGEALVVMETDLHPV
jgi:hypothetical protein